MPVIPGSGLMTTAVATSSPPTTGAVAVRSRQATTGAVAGRSRPATTGAVARAAAERPNRIRSAGAAPRGRSGFAGFRGPTGAQPLPLRPERRLGAVADADLLVDPGQMGLDRLLADLETLRDQLVREALADQHQHLALAGTEVDRALLGPVAEDGLRGARCERRLASGRRPDRLHQLGRLGVLQQIADRSRVKRAEDPLALGERGQDHDLGLRAGGADSPCRLDPVDLR